MQPYHEYECTGVKDQYVVDVDVTDKVIEEFNQPQKVVIFENGRVVSRWDEQFYKRQPGIISSTDFIGLPCGAREVEMSAAEARKHGVGYKTLDQCAKDYGGYKKKNGRYYDETNPSAKWDWWVIGGRWTGFLNPIYEPEDDPNNIERCTLCRGTGKRPDMEVANGCNGCQGKGLSVKWPTQWVKFAGDQMQKSNIPIGQLRAKKAQEAAARWDAFQKILNGRVYPDWTECVDRHSENYDAARDEFHSTPVVMDVKNNEEFFWLDADEARDLQTDRAQYIASRENAAIAPFAFIDLDGRWNERGEMGWFGCSRNEKEKPVWSSMFRNYFESLPPTAWVTVVDCHI